MSTRWLDDGDKVSMLGLELTGTPLQSKSLGRDYLSSGSLEVGDDLQTEWMDLTLDPVPDFVSDDESSQTAKDHGVILAPTPSKTPHPYVPLRLGGHGNFDAEPSGGKSQELKHTELLELSPSRNDDSAASCDIVFVHGLNGHPEDTWKFKTEGTEDADTLWPRDFLCEDYEDARVFSYGYDADLTASGQFSIWEILARDLVKQVSARRQSAVQASAPIIWVAHSLGGLMVKAALVLAENAHRIGLDNANISSSTIGILFFGTPHSTRSWLGWEAVLSRIASVSSGITANAQASTSLTIPIGQRLDDFRRLLTHFSESLDHLRVSIFSFYETRPTLGSLVPVTITNGENALQHPSEKVGYLIGSHVSMCKFHSRTDDNYVTVNAAIREILNLPQNYNPRYLSPQVSTPRGLPVNSPEPAIRRTMSFPAYITTQFDELSNSGEGVTVDQEQGKTARSVASLPHSTKLTLVKKQLNVPSVRRKHVADTLKGTFDWILNDNAYKVWDDEGHFLLITGPPGCGKSVAAKFIVNHLQAEISRDVRYERKQKYILHFFFSSQTDMVNAEGEMLAQFLLQLLDLNELLVRHFEDKLAKLYEPRPEATTQGQGTEQVKENYQPNPASLSPTTIAPRGTFHEPNRQDTSRSTDSWGSLNSQGGKPGFEVQELVDILNSILNDREVAKCHFVIDGLDECDDTALDVIMKMLKKFKNIPKVRVCLTYRPEEVVNKAIAEYLGGGIQPGGPLKLLLQNDDCFRDDIKLFTKKSLEVLSRDSRMPDQKFADIKVLLGKSKTYLWISLVTSIFAALPDLRSINGLIHLAGERVDDLHYLYDWAFRFLVMQEDQRAVLVLCFVALSKHTLRIEDLAVLLAASDSKLKSKPGQVFERPKRGHRLRTVEDLEQSIRFDLATFLSRELLGLVQVNGGIVMLAHSSLRDFLLGPRCTVPGSESDLDSTCSSRGFLAEQEHFGPVSRRMAEACLILLNLEKTTDTGYKSSLGSSDWDKYFNEEKFRLYPLTSWADHARDAGEHGKRLYEPLKEVWQLMDRQDRSDELLTRAKRALPEGVMASLPMVLAALDLPHILPLALEETAPRESPEEGKLTPEVQAAALNSSWGSIQALETHKFRFDGEAKGGLNVMDLAGMSKGPNLQFLRNLYSKTKILPKKVRIAILDTGFTDWTSSANVKPILLSAIDRHAEGEVRDILRNSDVHDRNWAIEALEVAVDKQYENLVRLMLEWFGLPFKNKPTTAVSLGKSVGIAARRANYALTKLLLDNGADCNQKDQDGASALHYGAQSGESDVVQLLVKAKAHTSAVDATGQMPLHRACRRGHVQVLEYLMSSELRADNKGRTPLYMACKSGSVDSVRVLLEYGARINEGDSDGRTPLHVAASRGAVDVVRVLLANGPNVNARSEAGTTPLHDAARGGLLLIAFELLAAGADPNLRDTRGHTPLHHAAMTKPGDISLEMVDLLVGKYLADPNVADAEGRLPLLIAAEWGNISIVPYLADHSALYSPDRRMRTALHYAAASPGHHPRTVRHLLDVGFGRDAHALNARDDKGRTAVLCAAEAGDVDVVKAFLRYDAVDLYEKDDRGRDVWDVVEALPVAKRDEMLRALKERGLVRGVGRARALWLG